MDHFPSNWGKARRNECDFRSFSNGDAHSNCRGQIANNCNNSADYTGHTTSPIVTGTSVLGIVYKDGVMLAADCLASYGSLARFRDVQRVNKISENAILATSGDISDMQHLLQWFQSISIEEYCHNDGSTLEPHQYYSLLANYLYEKRTDGNPLWTSNIVGGIKNDGKRFLAYADLLGTTYESSTIATGYGAYIAQPLLRKAVEGKEDVLTYEEAKKILEDSLKVLFYRDARSLNKIQIATISSSTGLSISEPYSLKTDWKLAESIKDCLGKMFLIKRNLIVGKYNETILATEPKKLMEYLLNYSSLKEPTDGYLQKLDDLTKAKFPNMSDKATSNLQGRLLSFIANFVCSFPSSKKRFLDIGTFTGRSALCIAEALEKYPMENPVSGFDKAAFGCWTIENDSKIWEFTSEFTRNCVPDSIKDKIEFINSDAKQILQHKIPNGFDFDMIFLDADKSGYMDYFNIILEKKLLSPTGILIVDNTIWRGKVLDGDCKYSKIIHEFNNYVARDNRVFSIILPLFDGLTFITHKKQK